MMLGDDAGHAPVLAHERDRRRLVDDLHAAPLGGGVERLQHFRTAAPDVQREPAPELELAVHLVGLPAEAGLQLHALAMHPGGGFEAVADQDFAEVLVGAVLRQLEHVVEILLFGVAAEVDVREVVVRHRGQHLEQVLDAGIGEAERAAGEMRIAAALLERGRFQHQHARAVLAGGDRSAERGIAGADHKHVGPLARKIGCGHRFLAGSAQVMHRRGCALRPPAASLRSQ